MKYSIIIPALNEEKYIKKTIHALQKQNFPKESFEIIVVDNGSDDHTIEYAKNAGANIVVLEEKRGTNRARNRGIKESHGEILVFLDADTEPHEQWIALIDKIMNDKNIAAISGPYDYGFSGVQRILSFFIYDIGFEFIGPIMSTIFRKKVSALIGGNFAIRKTTIEKIGKFPEIPFWGDDTAISMSVMKNGDCVVFTRKLKIKSSNRRYKSQGFLKLSLLYFYHFLKMYFTFRV
ncbi:MAG: glycosyltransferase [Candidatus Paceibacterota bacterium]|jgi:glycosyltransferase involved in cell wall biosynthesis